MTGGMLKSNDNWQGGKREAKPKECSNDIHLCSCRSGILSREAKLILGSVKTNVGHAEGAAGACSVAKGAFMMYHKQIPGSLHLKGAASRDPIARLWYWSAAKSGKMARDEGRFSHRMSSNSFGIGGTNTHVILEEFFGNNRLTGGQCVEWPVPLLPLSARDRKALRE